MGAVSNLRPSDSLESHLEFLFRNETGYVYAPNKSLDLQGKSDPKGVWSKRFFLWPQQKSDIVEYVETTKKFSDVYLSPSLFIKPFEKDSESIECVKGSFTFWVDFDGKIPTEADLREANAPFPSWRNCSSTEGHEHWYWSSPTFVSNIADLQDTNKALTYALDGDKGGWYAHKVLRPVSGINHKRNGEEVTIAARLERHYPLKDFSEIPIPNYHFTEAEYNPHKVPPALEVICKFEIKNPDFIDLIKKSEIREGNRSSALSKLALYCVEHGMDNHETLSIVQSKDKQWGKYIGRPDPVKCYIDLVNYARNKTQHKINNAPLEGNEDFRLLGWMDVINLVDNTKYVIEGLLPEDAIMVIAGRSGSQKTTLAMDMTKQLVLGSHRFNWRTTITEQLRVMMLSMEMPFTQIKEFMIPGTPEDREFQEILTHNFKINDDPFKFYDKGEANVKVIQHFVDSVVKFRPHIVLLDSATIAIAPGDQNPKDVQASIDLLKSIIKKLHFSVIIIAHTRKDPPKSGYREKDLDDLFGAQNLAAAASAVIGIQKELDKDGKETGLIDVKYLKTRFMGSNEKFQIAFRPEDFSFYRPAISPEYVPTVQENEPPVAKGTNGGFPIPI